MRMTGVGFGCLLPPVGWLKQRGAAKSKPQKTKRRQTKYHYGKARARAARFARFLPEALRLAQPFELAEIGRVRVTHCNRALLRQPVLVVPQDLVFRLHPVG
jgi:hypothetical protein